jgi:AraC-like DNA-binding protein
MARDTTSDSALPRGSAAQQKVELAQALADPFFAEALFDQLSDVVFFVKDTRGRYVVVNRTLALRCGCRDKAELIGRLPVDVFPAELGPAYAAQDQYVVQTGEAIHSRLELHLFANRMQGWCLTDKIPLRDRAGQIIGLAGISRDLRAPDTRHPVYERIAEAVAFVQQHYAEALRLEDLAQLARLSVDQLERYFQRIFDLTPKQLIIKTRLDAATRLLAGDESIAAVAYACGYADHSAFSRQFKATVGLSPGEYRRLRRGSAG